MNKNQQNIDKFQLSLKKILRLPKFLFDFYGLIKFRQKVKAFQINDLKNYILPSEEWDATLSRLINLLRTVDIELPFIRIGSSKDGGYVLPNLLSGVESVFSPGVGNSSSFEKYFADAGVQCFLADASVDNPPDENSNFHFVRAWVGASSSNENSISLSQWMDQSNLPKTNFSSILQCDIEGGEWVALDQVNFPERLHTLFRYLVIEFHDLQKVLDERHSATIIEVLQHLNKNFQPAVLATNNYQLPHKFGKTFIPPVVEVTYISRKFLAEPEISKLSNPRFSNSWKKLIRRNEPFLPQIRSSL
jgi:hypothetical protein